MKGYQKSFQLGSLSLSNNIIMAPMAGYTDKAFRQMMATYKPGLMFCEMVKIEALVRKDHHTLNYLEYDDSFRPIGAQICGSNPTVAADAAKIVEDLGFDILDINCGCPVPKVTKDGSGSAMLLKPELIEELLNKVIEAVKIPVTIKIRAGWDKENIIAEKIVNIAEAAGAAALTIHGRTRNQRYKGKADREIIRLCKQRAKKIKIIGNGDIWTAQDAYDMFNVTGCDGIMLARGALGKPWLVQEIEEMSLGKQPLDKDTQTLCLLLKKHYDLVMQNTEQERKILFDMRRIACWYLKSFTGAKSLRIAINTAASPGEIMTVLEDFQRKTK